MKTNTYNLLTINCHEAWIYQLSQMGGALEIIHDEPGHRITPWDFACRPLPDNGRLISLQQALSTPTPYDCLIAHNMSDLLLLKEIACPKILVLHATLEGRLIEGDGQPSKEETQAIMAFYLQKIGAHGVAVSQLKSTSWQVGGDMVLNGADPDDFLPWSGEIAAGLRVANQITIKKELLAWDLHQAAFGTLPVRIVGNNPDRPGVIPAPSWQGLKNLLSQHRFFIHTANPTLEDGFNMAMMEAMAAGLPVIGNHNPSSPIIHGVNGFLSDDPAELKGYAQRLLEDRTLAQTMGQAAQTTLREQFPLSRFHQGFSRAIETAQKKYQALISAPTR
ncbi:MAG: glycosyltransferase [Magnetococcales bacterium]|nr:glycosyltransferase [Magnetococcales bacterium]